MDFVAALLVCCASLSISQTQSVLPAQSQPPARANGSDSASQGQRVDIDRDPVSSPDSQDNVPESVVLTPKPEQAVEKGKGGPYTLHANVDEVLLNCAVMDQNGRAVTNLDRSNFRVWEDGVPQTVNSVRREDLPVSMGILVDNSGSMRDKRSAVNQAAFDLLKASNPQDEAFVVNFSDRAFLDQKLTTDLIALNRGLSRFDSKGTTALYDAVAASASELARHAKHRKQVILIITDGEDNASRLDLEQAVRRVQDLGGPGGVFNRTPLRYGEGRIGAGGTCLGDTFTGHGGHRIFPKLLARCGEHSR